MRLNALIFLVTILLGAGLTLWLDKHSTPPAPPSMGQTQEPITEESAPEFSFVDINGQKHMLSEYQGKIVILNFWATWCPPCVVEFPKLATLATEHKDIVLIALSSDSKDDKVNAFIKKQKTKLPDNMLVARDDKRKITADLYKTYKLPESLIIAPSGKIAKKIVGDTDWNGEDIKAFLQGLKS